MFTTPCWLFIVILPSVFGCWFSGRTRNSKEDCYGPSKPLPPGLARASELPEHTIVCLRHLRMIESQDNRCSAPFQEKHSKKLTEIPATHYGIIDNYGRKNENFRPGSKWCHACKRKFYKKTEGESGMARRKRSKVNIGNSLVSLHLHFIKSVTRTHFPQHVLVTFCIENGYDDQFNGKGDRVLPTLPKGS